MSQELVYSIIPRPTLMPEDLVFKRKVQALAKTIKAQKLKANEQEFSEQKLSTNYTKKQKNIIDELA